MKELVSLVRFLLLFTLVLATEALAGEPQGFSSGKLAGLWEEVTREDPDSGWTRFNIGKAHYELSYEKGMRAEDAARWRRQGAEEMEKALLRGPSNSATWHEVSKAWENIGEYARAAAAMHQCVLFAPSDEALRVEHVSLLSRAGQPEAQLEALNAWIVEHPESRRAYEKLADFLAEAGKVDEAIRAYRESSRRGGGGSVHMNLGDLLAGQGRWREAAEVYRRELNGPDYAFASYSLGVTEVKLGHVKEARKLIESIEEEGRPYQKLLGKHLRELIQDPQSKPLLGEDCLKEP